jgi:filamentous hemagglutinin
MAKDVHDEAHNSKSTNGSSDPSSGSDPVYENPGTHDPNSPNYNSTKETIPDNAEELFNANKKNVEPDGRTIWAKEGNGKKAVYHRFQGSNGKWHWNGSTAGGKRQIPMDKVPVDVKRR